MTLGGRLFQARAAATGKAQSPTVESLVRGTSSAPTMWIKVTNGSQHLRRGEDQLTDKTVPDHVGSDRQAQLDQT